MDAFEQAIRNRVAHGQAAPSFSRRILVFLHRALRAVALRVLPEELINPRIFSNVMLRTYGATFEGDIINVSGWDDGDKRGGKYKSYFPNARTYVISNAATEAKGLGAELEVDVEEFPLDLNYPVDPSLLKKYDVVFNHTTLEHVLHFEQAFENLCTMSRDAVIIVVPTLQQMHFASGFGDYWRPTPLTIAKLFYRNGLTPIVLTTNDQAFGAIYIFAIGVRNPKKYEGKIEARADFNMGAELYGSGFKYENLAELFGQNAKRD